MRMPDTVALRDCPVLGDCCCWPLAPAPWSSKCHTSVRLRSGGMENFDPKLVALAPPAVSS